ncbi:hypothetical protein [Aeromonas hydrophila]|uniref:hypothetical protein n=1 Tax=Aeromonas hydrophila TaxID=644 RepID=UPI0006913B5A|nr:hypothetical protein [Aeromonas hydrophila]OFC42728.1 hypothetical protein BA189_04225 [Aeromonas hydrophila]OFC52624.1 hypothetical protein BA188_11535 [Aeromonas hydrophila]
MILGFGNNVVSSIAEDLTASQETIQVMPGAGAIFEGLLTSDFENKSTPLNVYAKITLSDAGATVFEVCHLISVSGDVLNVIRGREGTLAKGWSLNDVIANFATRGSESGFAQIAQLQAGTYTAGSAGGTANALTLELPSTFFTNASTGWELKAPLIVYPIHNNTGASTLQLTIGGRVLGTFPIYKYNLEPLDAGDILKDVGFACLLDSTKSFFTIIGVGVGALPATDYRPRTDHLTLQQGPLDIIKGADLNDCQAGDFGAYDNSTRNRPVRVFNFFYCETLCVRGSEQTQYLLQRTYPISGAGAHYWRNYDPAKKEWSQWVQIYDSLYYPEPSEIGAAKEKHGHTPEECGAAPVTHSHDWSQVGAPERVAGGHGELIPEGEYNQLLSQSGFFNNSGGLGAYGDPFPGQWAYFFHNSHSNPAGFCGSLAMNFGGTQLRYGAISAGVATGWKTIFTQDEPPQVDHIPGLQDELNGKSNNGHHHSAIEANWDIISDSWGQIGTYALAGRFDNGGQLSPGDVIAGSSIKLCSAEGVLVGVAPPGTWKALGYVKGDRDYGSWNVTLFIRIV